MGTVHSLAGRRAGRAGARRADVALAEELANWTLLAGRAGDVLAALEGAAAARRRPGLAALTAEAAGLRAALESAVRRQIVVREIAREAYARAAADRAGRSPRPAASRRERPRPVPGGAS